MLALSLDMCGTHIGCAVVRGREILAWASLDSEKVANLASLLPSISETLRQLLAKAGAAAAGGRESPLAFLESGTLAPKAFFPR